jgi:hypothetical protein
LFPEHWEHEKVCEHGLAEILVNQHLILKAQKENMSALTDLQDSVKKLETEVAAFISANSGGASDADLVALRTQVDAIAAQVAPK